MKDNKPKKKSSKFYWSAGILTFALIIACVAVFVPWSTLYPPETTPSTVLTESTFTLIDYRTGEDVTPWVEVSVWTPDSTDLPFDNNDPYIITNFDEEISSADADTVEIDLRDHAVAWLEIDPDFESDYGGYNGVYNAITSRDMRKITGGANYDYTVYVYHIPTNVSIAMLGRGDMDSTGFPYLGDAQPYNNTWHPSSLGVERGTSGTWTTELNLPYGSTLGYHAGVDGGDEWDIDDEELADIVADAAIHDYDVDYELLWLQDQSNHRTIAPLYDLTDDTERDFLDDLEKVTNCFAIKYTMNQTISETDGNVAQVNFTIMDRDYNVMPADIVYDVASIWVIFYAPITCYNHFYNFDAIIQFGSGIFLSSVTTNRLITPQDRHNLGATTLLNTMFLDLHA